MWNKPDDDFEHGMARQIMSNFDMSNSGMSSTNRPFFELLVVSAFETTAIADSL